MDLEDRNWNNGNIPESGRKIPGNILTCSTALKGGILSALGSHDLNFCVRSTPLRSCNGCVLGHSIAKRQTPKSGILEDWVALTALPDAVVLLRQDDLVFRTGLLK